MDRGNATFEVMKGFENLTTKSFDGTPDTLPGKMKGDVTDSADIDRAGKTKSGVNAKKSDNTAGGPGITMRPDAKDIEDKADGDIESGYVSDVQKLANRGKRNKGYEGFNDLVSKGVVVDTSFDKFDVDNSMAMIEKEADFQLSMATDAPSSWMVEKAPQDDMIVAKGMSFAEFEEKGVKDKAKGAWEAGKEAYRAVKSGRSGLGVESVGHKVGGALASYGGKPGKKAAMYLRGSSRRAKIAGGAAYAVPLAGAVGAEEAIRRRKGLGAFVAKGFANFLEEKAAPSWAKPKEIEYSRGGGGKNERSFEPAKKSGGPKSSLVHSAHPQGRKRAVGSGGSVETTPAPKPPTRLDQMKETASKVKAGAGERIRGARAYLGGLSRRTKIGASVGGAALLGGGAYAAARSRKKD